MPLVKRISLILVCSCYAHHPHLLQEASETWTDLTIGYKILVGMDHTDSQEVPLASPMTLLV